MAAARDLPVQLRQAIWDGRGASGPAGSPMLLRVWTAGDTTVAIGFVDEASLIRMALAPPADHDEDLAQALVGDLEDPTQARLHGSRSSSKPASGRHSARCSRSHGWVDSDPWTPLVRDLSDPVEGTDLRVEVVGDDRVEQDRWRCRVGVFERSTFTAGRWRRCRSRRHTEGWRCLRVVRRTGQRCCCGHVWAAGPWPGRPACWSRWASTGTIAVTGTVRHQPRRGCGPARAWGLPVRRSRRRSRIAPPSPRLASTGYRRLDRRDRLRIPALNAPADVADGLVLLATIAAAPPSVSGVSRGPEGGSGGWVAARTQG